MSDPGSNAAPSSGIDIARLERTLQASIKLMKRGRREMERMRRKAGRQEHPGEDQTAA